MSELTIKCRDHGAQGIAIACIHVCRAIDSGENVGFFWLAESTAPRPDAWCQACEQWLNDNPDASGKEWMRIASFQMLCVRCWDEAKERLYSRFRELNQDTPGYK